MTELSVVVPFYNEEHNLARYPLELFVPIDALGIGWELILVDDGSADGSLAVAESLVAKHPDARICRHERNRGLGRAVRTGIDAARGSMVLTLDADLTFHPRQVSQLYERYRRGDVDVVLGSPDLAGYKDVAFYRIFLSRGANLLYQIVLGARLTAMTPIFRLYRRDAIADLELESERFDINAEILAKLLLKGGRVAEVPAVLTTRIHGESKLDNLTEIRNHLRLLTKILRWRINK